MWRKTTLMSAASHFPAPVLGHLASVTGLDSSEAWNNIMKLSCYPEQGTLEWWKFYNYIEKLSYDGAKRGYTVGFFGATTADGNTPGDAIDLFRVYKTLGGQDLVPLVKKDGGHDLVKTIKGLGADPKWQEAQWTQFIKTYVTDTMHALKKRGILKPSALSIASLLDCAFNQGSTGKYGMFWVCDQVPATVTDEHAFLAAFLDVRSGVAGKQAFNDPPINGRNRTKQYQDLVGGSCWTLTACDEAIAKATSWELK